MAENFSNNFSTALDGAIDASQTTFDVLSVTGAPAVNYRIKVENELMLVTGVATLTLTVTRGVEGTTGASHADATLVTHVVTAGGLGQAVAGGAHCEEAFMTADSLSSGGANALFDLTGASLSLAAGDWLVSAFAYAKDSNSATTLIGLAIHNGTSAIAMSAGSKPAGANDTLNLSVSARITLASTTTVKLQGISVRTTTTFIRNAAATFGAGATDTATGIHAVKVTAV